MHTQEGLTDQAVAERRLRYGFNDMPTSQSKSFWRIAREVLKEPMFALLIACGTLYMLIGDYREGIVQLTAIVLIILITFFQYRKNERALDALRALAAPKARVIRNGKEGVIAAREVVPDDVMVISEGSRIVADGHLIESLHVLVDEALLTGESMPVEKIANDQGASTSEVYNGTLVVRGQGRVRVTAIGTATRFGQIGLSLSRLEAGETRLQGELRVLIRTLFIIGVSISMLVVLAFYLTRLDFVQAMLNGLAASMSILPEEFPVVVTVFLALGAWRLSQQNVLTRQPSAIESLGSATVLCSDKTGTITQNKMEVIAIYDGQSIIESAAFEEDKVRIEHMIQGAHLASSESSVDPMEQAIAKVGSQIGLLDMEHHLIREYPLSRELLSMTRVHQKQDGDALVVVAKGSPESILQLCRLQPVEVQKHMQVVHELASRGHRLLAVAEAPSEKIPLPDFQHGFSFQFLGLLAFADPIREEVPAAVKACQYAGIRVIMITGDYPTTAKSIAGQIGLPTDGALITGDELTKLGDTELALKIDAVSVFARVLPEQKLRIVEALKSRGEIIAMTGDGVNDAPALKAAHIGIAMGMKGTDVAREASALVLLDDQFASIVKAIRLGRRIYDNMQKAMAYIMAIHIPIIGLVLLPAFIPALPILLMPLHIVFLELIIDPVCSIAFESEQEEKDIMKRPPRRASSRFFGWSKIGLSVLKGLLILLMVCTVYFIVVSEGHADGELRAICFSGLILGNLVLILTSLSKTRGFWQVFKEQNHTAFFFVLLGLLMLVSILCIPFLRGLFVFTLPTISHFLPVIMGAVVLLVLFESLKYFRASSRT